MKKGHKHKSLPDLHHKFFWDTDVSKLNWRKAYEFVISRIMERGSQDEVEKVVRFYGKEKVIKALKEEIYFLPNYAIDRSIEFFPELKKEEMYCYLNRKDKPYHWI